MELVVNKYGSFAEADEADLRNWRRWDGEQKLAILLDLVLPEDPDAAVIERSARVYPLVSGSRG